MPLPPSTIENYSGPVVHDWILVVDDDAPIRQLLTHALKSETMDVVTAEDGNRALGQLDERSTAPLMAIIDVLMPGMDGLTLARKLLARLPRTKIVLMSGHLNEASWWPTDLREITFLPKPFRIAELKDMVASVRAERLGQR
jgi:two-component system cell cycle sensor histidine kinase/response regulator CckA